MPTTELSPPLLLETHTLRALADRIVPPDGNGPGGADGGGAAHLLRELAPGGALADHYIPFQTFLARLNEAAGGDFAALTPEVQDELLMHMEANPEAGPVFRRVVEWVTEGFYASPAGWDRVGFRPVDRGTR